MRVMLIHKTVLYELIINGCRILCMNIAELHISVSTAHRAVTRESSTSCLLFHEVLTKLCKQRIQDYSYPNSWCYHIRGIDSS